MTASSGTGNAGFTFTGIFCDVDEDGWPDIFVGNDKGYDPGFPPNATYKNNGDGTFTDISPLIGTDIGMGAMGSDFTDAFNDGGWDIFVSNDDTGHVFHVQDPTTGTFPNLAAQFQVTGNAEAWSVHWLDYDNDGLDDLYVVHYAADNHLYHDTGWPGPRPEVGAQLGANVPGQKFEAAVVDYDNDGRLDVLVPKAYGIPGATSVFLRNTVSGGNWLRVRTAGSESNRDGIGAVLEAHVGATVMRRQVRSGTGFLGCSDLRVHFGLGSASAVDLLVVRWPSGQVQRFWDVPAGQELVAHEPRLSLAGVPLPGSVTALEHDSPDEAGLMSVLYLSLGTDPGLPLPDGRVIPGNLDFLGTLTLLAPGNPILPQPYAFMDGNGFRSTALLLPPVPALSGITFHATGACLDGTLPWPWSPVRNILKPLSVTIQ